MESIDQSLNYENYLKINSLLSLQKLLSEPRHHDEMLFILIHQVYELWFKLIIHELDEVKRCFADNTLQRSLKVLNRITTVQHVLIEQINVLETMTPNEFAAFRDKLRPASGFQSYQFREVEFMCGLKQPRFLEFFKSIPEGQAKLQQRMDEKTVYDHFLNLLAQHGFAISDATLNRDVTEPYTAQDDVLKAIEIIYTQADKYHELYSICESLLSLDENFRLWRFRHVMMVERTIGTKTGTGGSSGAKYLAPTVELRLFPELWDVRNQIGTY